MKNKIGSLHGVAVNSIFSGEYFRYALSSAMIGRPYDAPQLDIFDASFYNKIISDGGFLLLSKDNLFGIYISADGEIGSLFKNRLSKTIDVASYLLEKAIECGGRYFNAYGTQQLESLYVSNKFNPVARMRFNEKLAPEGWQNSSLISKPDVVFFTYSPNGIYNVGCGKYFDDWNAANEYAKTLSKAISYGN